MYKDFDRWNKVKKEIDCRQNNQLVKEGEIWWCSIGLNIGDEENGKGSNFERPVLIIKKFNSKIFITIPLSSQEGHQTFYKKIFYNGRFGFVIISQIRILDVKRLKRLIGKLGYKEFREIKDHVLNILK